MTKRVFLGGTANKSTWREELIPLLDENKISYFNPVVEDWTPECQEEEIRQRATCDYVLYVITKQMLGFYAIAEVVEDSNKRPSKTIFGYSEEGFKPHQIKSLQATAKLVKENGAQVFTSLSEIANYLNNQANLTEEIISQQQGTSLASQQTREQLIMQQEQPTRSWFWWMCK